MAEITDGHRKGDMCPIDDPWNAWLRLKCDMGFVTRVSYAQMRHAGNFRLEYLPNTVSDISITRSLQKYTVDTRQLPLYLDRLVLYSNQLYGSFDFPHLPPQMRQLNLMENAFCGVVNLSFLPVKLENLWLSHNQFSRVLMLRPSGERLAVLQCTHNPLRRDPILAVNFVCQAKVNFSESGVKQVVDAEGAVLFKGAKNF